MAEFRIVTFGVKEAASYIEGLGANAANARPAFEEIYLTILDIEHEAFEKEGARSGFSRWQKNAIDTILWKAKRHLSPKILQASTRLMQAVTSYRSPDMVTRIGKDSIIFAPKLSALPYARVHQKGGKAGHSMIPARPYIRFSKQDQNAFALEIIHHITKRRGPGRIGVQL